MIGRVNQLRRHGISLTEVLIGIMVLGIGVISLATLFPIGLLRLRRAVNDVRGTITAQSAANECRIRNLAAPPFGPWFYDNGSGGNSLAGVYSPLSADPDGLAMLGTAGYSGGTPPFRPTTGRGIPVVIDPLWMLQNTASTAPVAVRLGAADINRNGTVDFLGGQGFVRASGGFATLETAYEVFASPDDLVFMDEDQLERQRIIPLQNVQAGPSLLLPTNGVPFQPGTLFREPRYTWMAIVRKTSAAQIYNGGDNGVGAIVADSSPPTSVDTLDNVGADLVANYPRSSLTGFISTDDPARDLPTGAPVLAPVGPFDVTIVVYYNRDFTAPEVVFTNNVYPVSATAEPSTNLPIPIFSPVPRRFTLGGVTYTFGPNEATLVQRSDGVPFPDIQIGGFVLDSTFDGSVRSVGGTVALGPRGGNIYRVIGKSLNAAGNILVLTLDRPARPNGPVPAPNVGASEPPYALPFSAGADPNGYVLTYLRGAVGVFERQMP